MSAKYENTTTQDFDDIPEDWKLAEVLVLSFYEKTEGGFVVHIKPSNDKVDRAYIVGAVQTLQAILDGTLVRYDDDKKAI